MIVSTAQPTGRFDHAALSPKNDLFLAGASVQFTAHGRRLQWLSCRSARQCELGAGGQQLRHHRCKRSVPLERQVRHRDGPASQGKTVLGTTSVEVQEPEELFFAAETLNLSFQESSDLGLTAKSGTRLMDIGGYVFDWAIMPTDPGKQPSDIGSFSGQYVHGPSRPVRRWRLTLPSATRSTTAQS